MIARTAKSCSFVGRAETLLAQATAQTGLSDFGDPNFRDGYDRFLASLDAASRLTEDGCTATEAQIGLLLRCRLSTVAGWKARPDCLQRPVVAPLIITGIVRSGTTALHRLLSIDPRFQGFEHWLVRAPKPRPPLADWPDDPAYRAAGVALDQMIAAAPEMLNDHMMTVDAVEESIFLLAPSFANNMFPSQWTIPDYDAWYRGIDERPCYRWLADTLRLIGVDTPDRRWLLKNPTDLHAIDAVLEIFPDAKIILTHRDPVQAIPSIANLLLSVRGMFEGDRADPRQLIDREADFWAEALRRTEAAKVRRPESFIDIEFGDFVRDQMGAVDAIYRHFGMVLASDVEVEMRSWLAAHPRRPGVLQRHLPEEFGSSAVALAERFADYRKMRNYV